MTQKGLRWRTVPACSWRAHTLLSGCVFGGGQESLEPWHASAPAWAAGMDPGCCWRQAENEASPRGANRAPAGTHWFLQGCSWGLWLVGEQTPLRSDPQHHCNTRDAESRICGTCLSCTHYPTWQCPLKTLCTPTELGQHCTDELLQNCNYACTSRRINSAYGTLLRWIWYEAESWSLSRDCAGPFFIPPPQRHYCSHWWLHR